MSHDWADEIAHHLVSQGARHARVCLILGGVDTGKTTLTAALAKQLAASQPVGIVDADIGQSHIGPPTTVGWAVLDNPQVDFFKLTPTGISFVGDVTPERHLLQLTAGLVQGVQQLSKVTKSIVIDTPGFITGPAAAALWWTVQRILRPDLIVAVQQYDELSDILTGWSSLHCRFEHVKAPQIPAKSWQARRIYRQEQFARYFRDASLYNIDLTDVAVQTSGPLSGDRLVGRLAGLRDEKGVDRAIGIIEDWQQDKGIVVVRAPQLDRVKQRGTRDETRGTNRPSSIVHSPSSIVSRGCLVIGDATIDIGET